jgi:hypothetical protein
MARLGIVMPVALQHEVLLRMTCEAVGRIRTAADARLYVLANRLSVVAAPVELSAQLQTRCGLPVRVTLGDRSVAGSWNEGARQALADGCTFLLILANDVFLEPEAIDRLLAFGQDAARARVAVWSGVHVAPEQPTDPAAVTDGCDFSCCMLRPATLERHGWFDENFRPAYFEDNDYYARVVLGGDECAAVHAARFFHHGSQTIRNDPEMAHHVAWWWQANQSYFQHKWGVAAPANTLAEVLASYFPHPWNDPSKPLSWWAPP